MDRLYRSVRRAREAPALRAHGIVLGSPPATGLSPAPPSSQAVEQTALGIVLGHSARRDPARSDGSGESRHRRATADHADPARGPGAPDIASAAPAVGPERLLVTVPEAARLLHIGRRQAWEMVWRDELPVVRLGRSVRVAREVLEQFVLDRSRPYGE